MSLLDRFRPEWKHTDPEVRADAVRQLGASARETLAEVARTDSEAKIRGLAVKKIEDVDLLREIAGSDSDERVSELAAERANQLLAATAAGSEEEEALGALGQISDAATLVQVVQSAALEGVRSQALARISTTEDLLEVARQAPETAVRKLAIERLDDTEALTALALHEQFGELALAALGRIEDPKVWLRIAQSAEVKGVREEASRRLNALSDEEHPTRLAERRERQEQLITRVEALAGSTEWEGARDGIEEARSAWLEMGAAEDDELGERFFGARERFIQRFKAHLEEARQAEAAAAASQEPAPQAPQQEASQPEAPAPAAEAPAAPPAESAAAPAAESGAETPAVEVAETATPEPAESTEPTPAESAGDVETTAADAEAGAEPSQTEERKAKEKPQETPERGIARLKSLGDRLSSMTSSEHLNLRKAERALREAHSALSEPGPAHSHEEWPEIKKHLESARETLVPRVRQIEQEEEWKRWANVPLQEGLCERMEALIETEDLAKASRELRVLSDEWKTVATVPREKSEELWQRFRGAREKVREKVKGFLQEQDKDRKENLKKKTELCEQAETLADSTDWKEAAGRLKALQAEWKAIGPVPRKVSDSIWKRFRAA
ncbi:MAG: DUF349 domain-containing protein, partial [Acidobacteria bacterium]|nr:DUF349 domain-containing protein [Acidobacteriota bacterium]